MNIGATVLALVVVVKESWRSYVFLLQKAVLASL